MKKGLWAVNMSSGNMFIVRAAREASARNYAYRCFGEYQGPYRITRATETDVEWFKAMGGEIRET